MGISLRPEHLKRYRDMAWLLIKYGRADLVSHAGLDEALQEEDRPVAGQSKAEELVNDLEALGPTYIKLGQFLSTRSDMLPPEYLHALTRLQDNVGPFSYAQVEEIVTTELGIRMSKAFQNFETQPLAAASLSQVHRAVLRDGKPVVVKVQRPHIREQVAQDLDALEEVAEFLDHHTSFGRRYMLQAMLNEFRKSMLHELDFRREAHNLIQLRENLREYDCIVIPAPVEDYTTSKVLTMDYIHGQKITSISPLAQMEIDGAQLAEELFRAYLQQILIDGFYHADPHPGNVFLTDDNRVALLDLGMVAHISQSVQKSLLQVLLAVSEGRGDEAAKLSLEMSEATDYFDKKKYYKEMNELVAQYHSATMEQIEMGRVVLEMSKVAGDNGIRVPNEMTMLGKTLLNLDKVGRTLDPKFNPNASIRRNASSLVQEKMLKSATTGSLLETLMDTKEFVQNFPRRVNKILESVSNNELSINVNAIDEQYLMTGLQKIANRLTVGLILAAIIIGAALMMDVQTPFRIFNYPGIAILFFLLAAIGSVVLAVRILFYDEHVQKKE